MEEISLVVSALCSVLCSAIWTCWASYFAFWSQSTLCLFMFFLHWEAEPLDWGYLVSFPSGLGLLSSANGKPWEGNRRAREKVGMFFSLPIMSLSWLASFSVSVCQPASWQLPLGNPLWEDSIFPSLQECYSLLSLCQVKSSNSFLLFVICGCLTYSVHVPTLVKFLELSQLDSVYDRTDRISNKCHFVLYFLIF